MQELRTMTPRVSWSRSEEKLSGRLQVTNFFQHVFFFDTITFVILVLKRRAETAEGNFVAFVRRVQDLWTSL